MKHAYDLFEKFLDASSLWRDSVSGSETIRLHLQELAQRSENRFYATGLTAGKVLAFHAERDAHLLPTTHVSLGLTGTVRVEYTVQRRSRGMIVD
jgi:hypothetical protein